MGLREGLRSGGLERTWNLLQYLGFMGRGQGDSARMKKKMEMARIRLGSGGLSPTGKEMEIVTFRVKVRGTREALTLVLR